MVYSNSKLPSLWISACRTCVWRWMREGGIVNNVWSCQMRMVRRYAYSADQLEYHYTKNKEVLRRAVAAWQQQEAHSPDS